MYRRIISLILILMSIFFYNTCKKSTSPILNNKFQILVDSLNVPETVNLSDTINCKFWAFIGPNLCYQFSHFETTKNSEYISIKLWGFNTGANVCATAISELRGKEYKFVAEQKGIFRINVLQSNNSILKDSVLVN